MVFAEAEILAEDIALIALVCVSDGCGLGKNRHLFSTSMLVVLPRARDYWHHGP